MTEDKLESELYNSGLYRLIQESKEEKFEVPKSCYDNKPSRKVLTYSRHETWEKKNRKNYYKNLADYKIFADKKGWTKEENYADDEPEPSDAWIRKAYEQPNSDEQIDTEYYDAIQAAMRSAIKKDIVPKIDVDYDLKKHVPDIPEVDEEFKTNAVDRAMGYTLIQMRISFNELKNSTIHKRKFIEIWNKAGYTPIRRGYEELTIDNLNYRIKRIVEENTSPLIDRKVSIVYSEEIIKSSLSSTERLSLPA